MSEQGRDEMVVVGDRGERCARLAKYGIGARASRPLLGVSGLILYHTCIALLVCPS